MAVLDQVDKHIGQASLPPLPHLPTSREAEGESLILSRLLFRNL